MYTAAEMRELMDAGLHNDTYYEKLDAKRSRKIGWKVWGVDSRTAAPMVIERGFDTREDAVRYIRQQRKSRSWYVKEAEESDPDYYDSGEKGYWAGLSEEDYEVHCMEMDYDLYY